MPSAASLVVRRARSPGLPPRHPVLPVERSQPERARFLGRLGVRRDVPADLGRRVVRDDDGGPPGAPQTDAGRPRARGRNVAEGASRLRARIAQARRFEALHERVVVGLVRRAYGEFSGVEGLRVEPEKSLHVGALHPSWGRSALGLEVFKHRPLDGGREPRAELDAAGPSHATGLELAPQPLALFERVADVPVARHAGLVALDVAQVRDCVAGGRGLRKRKVDGVRSATRSVPRCRRRLPV